MTEKKKGFLGKLMDKMDKKMEKKAKKSYCCYGDSFSDDESCCK